MPAHSITKLLLPAAMSRGPNRTPVGGMHPWHARLCEHLLQLLVHPCTLNIARLCANDAPSSALLPTDVLIAFVHVRGSKQL